MPRRKQSRGCCRYCNNRYARSGMARHLRACDARKEALAAADNGPEQPIFHLLISDAYDPDFWLHLEMGGDQPLAVLDSYLRAIWLECCGHLSRFFRGQAWQDEVGMETTAAQIFRPNVTLTHIYDFGTSSETAIRVTDRRQGRAVTPHPLALMARNEAPVRICQTCDDRATHLCMECWEEDAPGLLCDAHTQTHPHATYGPPLLLANSPRMGLCGYEGPAEPPYY